MKNKALKKTQRTINYMVRMLNRTIENDELWKGRFAIKQINRKDIKLERDYFVSRFHFLLVDKQTKKQGIICFACWSDNSLMTKCKIRNELASFMNDFIVLDCKVWEENPAPNRETSINYRGVKI